ncbi:hypothetical protein PAXINDRAFT_170530 [Paxillus involutus ATCC 200175]|uniref:Unplaced genomic scaffold PAXINscaffold_30, whole genome shotgun sequence n=1 Tax=Paxillus involutus ATCC 200175 TaxID=664439 RepID=A0A0C9U176_PAXIN|nr:hypothetical protein PAXINDRAFT_170530 [Paxillus involutus ATCC 200175]
MLSVINLDAFRIRLRSKPMPIPAPSSSEDESDLSSSELPEQQPRRFSIHVTTPKNGRKSGEHLATIPDSGKAPDKVTGTKPRALTLNDTHPHELVDRQARTPSKPSALSTTTNTHPPSSSLQPPQPSVKPTFLRRVRSKLNITIPSSKSHTSGLQSQPPRTSREDVKSHSWLPRSPRVALPHSPSLPNGFVSKESREAALRERGLLPARKDLSEQERAADERLGCAPLPPGAAADGFSEAEQLKEEWLAINRTFQSGASGSALITLPHLENIVTSPKSTLELPSLSSSACSSPVGSRLSSEGKTDSSQAGRPSVSSTVPPLSTSSYLEVLHEDPSEQGPITPPPPFTSVRLPIIISTPVEEEFPSSHVFVESPVSCSFGSHLTAPGSASQSQLQLDGRSSEDKSRISFPPPTASRRRTTDSGDRRRKSIGPTLSKFGTNSLTNLRRSVAGSLRIPSSTTLSTLDLPPSPTLSSYLAGQGPRTAISPTMHSRGSILLETRDIKDAESRRLSELAFLD